MLKSILKLNRLSIGRCTKLRNLSSIASRPESYQNHNHMKATPGRMLTWSIHNYTGDFDEIVQTEVNKPTIGSPTEIVLKITASSVNPIDVAMMSKFFSSKKYTKYFSESKKKMIFIINIDSNRWIWIDTFSKNEVPEE